ncbi:MAG: hypothetical protein NT114_01765 [Patescibacteria group bacterium]|nr:hypothetical protein [Patescibacteria group bacterium]
MKSNRTATLFIGFALILLGLYMLARLLAKTSTTTNILDFWPALLIFTGLLSINPSNPDSLGISLGLMGLGVFGGLYRLGAFQTAQGQALLAVLLGLTGIVVLVMVVARSSAKAVDNKHSSQPINKSSR